MHMESFPMPVACSK